MLKFEWDEAFVLDGGQIDEEHHKLVDMANAVFEFEDPEANCEEIIELVKSLYRYIETHFEHEERLLKEVNYPGLQEHVAKHRQIVKDMTAALREKRDLNTYLSKLRHMMLDWVIQHIAHDDREYAAYLPQAVRQG